MQAHRILAAVERVADAADVPCKSAWQIVPRPWQGILRCARTGNCDLIIMASHGRGGPPEFRVERDPEGRLALRWS